NQNGQIVVQYSYTSYGVCSISGNTSLGNENPFRYKGYYYDVETSLYYVTTRYYDPEIGRFISPDDVSYLDPSSINGLNLYCYCRNNPIMYYDPNGHSALLVFASIMFLGIMGAASSVAVQAISDIANGNEFDIVNYLIAGGTGFIGGALSYINPYLGVAVQSALSTGLSMGYAEYKGKANYDWIDYTIAVAGSVGMSLLTTWGFGKIVNKTNAFETARIFGDNLSYWFDCGNKVFFEMLGDLTPYYLAYSLANVGGGLLGGWIPEYAREVVGLKRLGLSWGDSLKYAF
ncbi:MAG: RHS repeat-associated core domain-containing protein, partial [Bacilli bacterium]|nr:RHS repeat-associated core domain-containing protein [Bacilli bacterium]